MAARSESKVARGTQRPDRVVSGSRPDSSCDLNGPRNPKEPTDDKCVFLGAVPSTWRENPQGVRWQVESTALIESDDLRKKHWTSHEGIRARQASRRNRSVPNDQVDHLANKNALRTQKKRPEGVRLDRFCLVP